MLPTTLIPSLTTQKILAQFHWGGYRSSADAVCKRLKAAPQLLPEALLLVTALRQTRHLQTGQRGQLEGAAGAIGMGREQRH